MLFPGFTLRCEGFLIEQDGTQNLSCSDKEKTPTEHYVQDMTKIRHGHARRELLSF